MNPQPTRRLPSGALITESVNRAGTRATIIVAGRSVIIIPHLRPEHG